MTPLPPRRTQNTRWGSALVLPARSAPRTQPSRPRSTVRRRAPVPTQKRRWLVFARRSVGPGPPAPKKRTDARPARIVRASSPSRSNHVEASDLPSLHHSKNWGPPPADRFGYRATSWSGVGGCHDDGVMAPESTARCGWCVDECSDGADVATRRSSGSARLRGAGPTGRGRDRCGSAAWVTGRMGWEVLLLFPPGWGGWWRRHRSTCWSTGSRTPCDARDKGCRPLLQSNVSTSVRMGGAAVSREVAAGRN